MSMDSVKYQLEEMLASGFQDMENWQEYQSLKRNYEEETGDNQFSIMELEGRLNYLMTSNDYDWSFHSDFPKEYFREYMIKVGKLYLLDKERGVSYLENLAFCTLEES